LTSILRPAVQKRVPKRAASQLAASVLRHHPLSSARPPSAHEPSEKRVEACAVAGVQVDAAETFSTTCGASVC